MKLVIKILIFTEAAIESDRIDQTIAPGRFGSAMQLPAGCCGAVHHLAGRNWVVRYLAMRLGILEEHPVGMLRIADPVNNIVFFNYYIWCLLLIFCKLLLTLSDGLNS